MNLEHRLRDIEADGGNRLHLAPPNHECPNSTHIDGACRAGGGAVHSITSGLPRRKKDLVKARHTAPTAIGCRSSRRRSLMLRREFIAGLGSAAACPAVARAQRPAMPVIGLLLPGAPSSWDFTGFRQGLIDMGYQEGQNLAIDVRWANNDPDRLPGLAADLVHRQVRVIVAFGSVPAAS